MIHWPNVNIIYLKKQGGIKGGREERAHLWTSQNMHIYQLTLLELMHEVCGTPKPLE